MKKHSVFGILLLIAFTTFAAKQKAATAAAPQSAGKDGDSIAYETQTQWRVISQAEKIYSFYLKGSQLWYASASGLYEANPGTLARTKIALPEGTTPENVTSVCVDASGILYVGTKQGLFSFKDKRLIPTSPKSNLAETPINKVIVGNDGTVWVATDDKLWCLKKGSWETFGAAQGIPDDRITCVAIATDGTVWCGTPKGIGCKTGSSWKTHTMDNGLSWNNTKAISIDPRTSKVWAAVGEKDINTFDGKEWNQFIDINENIADILIDTQSRVWFGSNGMGLAKFNGEEWVSDKKAIGIPGNQFTQMALDGQGNLYFGVENGIIMMKNPYPF